MLSRTGESLPRVEDVHLLTGDTTFVANAPARSIAVFVEKREWTRSSADSMRSSTRSGKKSLSCGVVSIPL